MKKLMIALTAAATAFGLYADFSASEAFEEASPNLDNWEKATPADVVDGVHTLDESRPNAFIPVSGSPVANAKALKVATTVVAGNENAVTYNFNGGTAVSIDKGLYFDGIVKFTVFDMEDTPAELASDAKLAVFMQATDEDATASQLIVRAADGEGNANDYACTVAGATIDEGWHRLTIKAIDAAISGKAGFVVYVDEKMATCAATKTEIPVDNVALNAYSFYDKGALFISLAAGDTLSAVAFDGQGSIAEVEVSDTYPIHANPFARDEGAYVLSWPVTKVASITVGGETYTTTKYQDGKVTIVSGVGAVPENITVTWTAMPGYISNTEGKTISVTKGAATLEDADVKTAAAEVTIGGTTTAYETIAAAVAEVTDGATLKIINATADDKVELNNAKVTLDLNGQIVGDVGVLNGADITLANTGDGDAIIEGSVMANKIVTDVKTIKFNYEMNYNEDTGLPYFTADFGSNKWKIAKIDAYYVITDLELWTVTVADPLGTYVKTLTPSPAELYEDAEVKTVTLTATFETGYELDYYTVDGVKIEGDNFQLAKPVTVNAVAKSSTIPVTLSVTPATAEITEGDAIPTFTVMNGQTVADEAMYELAWAPETPTTESKAGEYTLTATPKAQYTGDPASATLTIKEKAAPVIDPTNPEKPAVVTAKDEDAAKDAVKISVPDAVKDAVGEDAYQAYFVKTATSNGDGTWNVTAALDDTVIKSDATAAELAGMFDEITEAGVTVENAKPGLYYSVVEGQALTGREEGPRSLATSDGVTIKATKFDNSGFYQIKVSTTDN